MTEEQIAAEVFKFRLPDGWAAECTFAGDTETPGIFYHGSPYVNIKQIKAEHAIESMRTRGAYFTHSPTLAAVVGVSRWGGGGRIYRAELVTRNPFYLPSTLVGQHVNNRAVEEVMCRDLRARGHDAIVTSVEGSTVFEIIVLDDAVIHQLDPDIGSVAELACEGATAADHPPPIFYQVEASSDLDCVWLFGNRRQTEAIGPARAVVVEGATNPIYCPRAAWPSMSACILRARRVDVLVDPADGSALVFAPEKIVVLNRFALRALKKLQLKGGRSVGHAHGAGLAGKTH